MTTATLSPDALLDKTKELCESILALPGYQESAKNVEAFLADDEARAAYVKVNERGQELHQRHHQGGEVTEAEAKEFQAQQETMLSNPVIAQFMTAQDQMNTIHSTVSKHVAKTLELGRLPAAEDLEDSCCSSGGCGCD